MASASQLRIGPPPADKRNLCGQRHETQARRKGQQGPIARRDTLAAKFWASYQMDPPMRQIADQPGRTTVQNARMYALIALASDDIGLMMADGKLSTPSWRPMNAVIRQADSDGNDDTTIDPLWEPLLRTPGQPEYPCGHCTVASVFSTILAAEGKPPPGGLHFT
ncbi:MAG: hypothetical protein IPK89_12385, partial [Sphingomonadales bacterium]|nr:hypothetical protein [Sphingomonadales bacterium]